MASKKEMRAATGLAEAQAKQAKAAAEERRAAAEEARAAGEAKARELAGQRALEESRAKAERESRDQQARIETEAAKHGIGARLWTGANTAAALGTGYFGGKALAKGIEARQKARVEALKGEVSGLAHDARTALAGSGVRNKTILQGISKNVPGARGPLGLGIAGALAADVAYTYYRSREARARGDDTIADILETTSGASALAATTLVGTRAVQNASSAHILSLRDKAALDAAKIAAKAPPGPEPHEIPKPLHAPEPPPSQAMPAVKAAKADAAGAKAAVMNSAGKAILWETKTGYSAQIPGHPLKQFRFGAGKDPAAIRAEAEAHIKQLHSGEIENALYNAKPKTKKPPAAPQEIKVVIEAPPGVKAKAVSGSAEMAPKSAVPKGPSMAELKAAARQAAAEGNGAFKGYLRWNKQHLQNLLETHGKLPGKAGKVAALMLAATAVSGALFGKSGSAEAKTLGNRLSDAGTALKENAGTIAEGVGYLTPGVGEALGIRDVVSTVTGSEGVRNLAGAVASGDMKAAGQAYHDLSMDMNKTAFDAMKAGYSAGKDLAHYAAGARGNRARYAQEAAGRKSAPAYHEPKAAHEAVSQYITHRGGKVVVAHFSPETLAARAK
jgi:hypothetical protein